MGRIKIEVDKATLVQTIGELESKQTFPNQNSLFQAVSETQWAVKNNITAAVIALRVREFNIELKTPKGKRGRAKLTPEQIANMQANRGTRTPRSEKFKRFGKHFKELAVVFPDKEKTVQRIRQGSMKAAVALKCYDCSGHSSAEIKACEVTSCPLYAFRPGATSKVKNTPEPDELAGVNVPDAA